MGADGRLFCAIRLRKRTNLSVLVTSEPDELSIPGQLARSKSAEGAALCPGDMMLCVISYWVLSGAKWRQIQQLRLSKLKKADLIYETRYKNYIYYELNLSILDETIMWISNLRGGQQ